MLARLERSIKTFGFLAPVLIDASDMILCGPGRLVERFINRIKQFRGIATRYDQNPANFMAGVNLICSRIWRDAQ